MVRPTAISENPGEGGAAAPLPFDGWWKSFFESSEDAHIVCRADGVILQINPRASRQLKLDRAGCEGSFCLLDAVLPPADRKLREVLQHQRLHPDTLHSVVVATGGTERGMVDLEITPLSDGDSLVTLKDAARRLRLESHVNRLVTAIDATPDVFLITDAEGRITFVNPAFHTMTGYSIEGVLGRTDEFLRDACDQDKVRAYLERARQGREWIGELVNVRSDGTTYHVEATISPISDMLGQVRRLRGLRAGLHRAQATGGRHPGAARFCAQHPALPGRGDLQSGPGLPPHARERRLAAVACRTRRHPAGRSARDRQIAAGLRAGHRAP